MGLFVGASILTVLEIFDYGYEWLKRLSKACSQMRAQTYQVAHSTSKNSGFGGF